MAGVSANRDAAIFRAWLALAAGLLLGGCGAEPTAPSPTCRDAPVLAPGEQVEGELSRSDHGFLGAFIDYFALDLADSTTVRATLTSARFDPFLYLFGPGQRLVAQAFDSAGAPPGQPESAVLIIRLGAGCHLIGASSWERAAAGRYNLRVDTLLAAASAEHGAEQSVEQNAEHGAEFSRSSRRPR